MAKTTKQTRKYSWRSGRYKVKPEVAAKEFERIRKVRGALTPNNIIEESTPEEAKLHNEFEWDNAIAGHRYRQVQARTMSRDLEVSVGESPARAVNVHVRVEKGEGRYETMEAAIEEIDLYDRALTELVRKMNAAVKAVQDLEGVAKGDSRYKTTLEVVSMAVKAVETASKAVTALSAA